MIPYISTFSREPLSGIWLKHCIYCKHYQQFGAEVGPLVIESPKRTAKGSPPICLWPHLIASPIPFAPFCCNGCKGCDFLIFKIINCFGRCIHKICWNGSFEPIVGCDDMMLLMPEGIVFFTACWRNIGHKLLTFVLSRFLVIYGLGNYWLVG